VVEDNKPKRRRRRRRGKPDGASSPERGGKPEGGPRPRRRRSRRADDAERLKPGPPADEPGQPGAAALSDVDLGWDDEPVDLPPEATRPPPIAAAATEKVRWGDDRDAPTPEIQLAADLPPPVDPDDPDPLTAELAELAELDSDGREALGREVADVAGVKFAVAGKIYLFDAAGKRFRVGDSVAVEGDRGTRHGTIAVAPRRRVITRALKKILRRQSDADRRSRERGQERAGDAVLTAKQRARDMGLELKIFRGELNPSGSKLTLYFSAEQKVDTRPLLRDLGAELQIRVELRQTGVRDEAKMVGGIGSCGRELCCTTWLPAFVPVSIKNAKDQGLVLNPTKVSGQCGRLKCCLVYEQETYAELRKGLPKLGKRVIADGDSEGRVVEVDVLRRRIRVNHGDGRFEVYEADQVEPMFPSQKPNAPRGDRAPDKSDSPSRPSQSKKKRRQSKKKRSDPPSD
jgi:cell fate regulator YaaT (PSP1 superfamily)